ncbi:MAG: prepilin-type N-terminal cleavage/methylation domain-containing protein [Planctomycetaceae bacterium]
MSPIRHRDRARRAFTLVELLLTLAVLVTISAIVVPSFGVLLADRRLARAGDQLRVEMMQTRLLAMRTGRAQILQLRVGASEARVKPWFDMHDLTEAVDQTGASSALLTGGNASPASFQATAGEEVTRNIELPPEVLVGDAQVESTQRSYLIDTQSLSETAEGWSQPILFYPDGTTSTAAVTFTQAEAGRVIVVLRGLTGEVTVTEVLAADESPAGGSS